MEFTGNIIDISINYKTKQTQVVFETNTKADLFEEIKSVDILDIKAVKHREKRTLDANAYAWVLISKLSNKLNIPTLEIYKRIIRDMHTFEIVPIKENAVDKFCEVWSKNGIGWITEVTPSKLQGYKNIMCYYGSSTYDKKEMLQFTESIIEECKENKIETMTPEQIDNLMKGW